MKFNKVYSSTPTTKPRIFFSIYISNFLELYLTMLRVVAQFSLYQDLFLGNPTAQLHLQSLSSCIAYPLKYFSVIKMMKSSHRREFSVKNKCYRKHPALISARIPHTGKPLASQSSDALLRSLN